MSKKLILGVLIIFILGVGGWLYFSQYQFSIFTNQSKEDLEEKKLPPPVHTLSDRAEKFSVSSKEDHPTFTKELIADPFKVKEGEEQYFSVWAKDSSGVEKVIAVIKTDKEDKILELKLVEGTEREGRWEGSWLAKDISLSDSYSTEFQIINKNNQARKSTFFWYSLVKK